MDSTLNSTRSTSLVICSSDRDTSVYPLASHYEVFLDEAVHDVMSMQLVVADVPFVAYLIHTTNSTIKAVLQSGLIVNAVIPFGDYTGAALATAVQASLQGQVPSSSTAVFTTVYSPQTDNIAVTCNSPYSLVFAETGSCALQMGFDVGWTYQSSGTTNTVAPTYRRNKGTNQSIILSIPPASVNTSVNQYVNQSFAIITQTRTTLSAASQILSIKNFNPPIARLSRVTVDFANYDGSPVDFQNHEHRLELMLVSLRAAKYQRADGGPTA